MTTLTLYNDEAEKEVLRDFLADGNTYTALAEEVTEELFTDSACQKCYTVIKALGKDGKIPEITEVGMRLIEQGVNVANFMSASASSFTLTRQRIDLLKELSVRRKLFKLGAEAQRIATSPTAEIEAFRQLLSDFNEVAKDENQAVSIGQTLRDLSNDVALRMNGKGNMGISTGLHIFDTRYGLHYGDLVIIAAETSQGKSTLASTMACNMATQGIPVAYYSLEMGANQLTARMIAKRCGIPSSRILYDTHISDEEFSIIHDISFELEDLPVFFDERSKTSFEKICTSIRAMVRKKAVNVAFIDYLQILANGKGDNRESIIGDMARELKNLATELGICVVALSQLNRDSNNHEPSLARLRGSGQVAEAADMVTLIYRPEVYGQPTYKGHSTKGLAELTIAKGRNIGLGSEFVKFNGELSYFEDYCETAKNEKYPWE